MRTETAAIRAMNSCKFSPRSGPGGARTDAVPSRGGGMTPTPGKPSRPPVLSISTTSCHSRGHGITVQTNGRIAAAAPSLCTLETCNRWTRVSIGQKARAGPWSGCRQTSSIDASMSCGSAGSPTPGNSSLRRRKLLSFSNSAIAFVGEYLISCPQAAVQTLLA